MKLKYLLRGIGIGFFTAGLVAFLVTLGSGKMSDEEILKRAEELGYVSAEQNSSEIVKLTDQTPINSTKEEQSEKSISEEIIPGGVNTSEETTSEDTSSEDAKKAEEEAKKKEEESKKAEEEAKKKEEEEAKKKAEEEAKKKEEEEAKKKAEEEAKKKEEEEAKKKAEEEAKKKEQTPTGETVTITVKSGQFSESVAKACESAGLVTSATEFDNFLCKNGYANRISVGDHVIAKGASFEEIAKALCK
ncbi:MAG: hypothetical protein IKI20_09815 [Lachnospiraceae bacterium]|nr:hypothetical protein [Lachnospiraceae bacterium]